MHLNKTYTHINAIRNTGWYSVRWKDFCPGASLKQNYSTKSKSNRSLFRSQEQTTLFFSVRFTKEINWFCFWKNQATFIICYWEYEKHLISTVLSALFVLPGAALLPKCMPRTTVTMVYRGLGTTNWMRPVTSSLDAIKRSSLLPFVFYEKTVSWTKQPLGILVRLCTPWPEISLFCSICS